LTIEECRILAATDRAAAKTNPRVKTAIVATDEVIQAFAYLYESEMLSSPWETDFFHTVDEAMKWAT